MDTMLPWQQKHVLVTLLLEGIGTLVHINFEATAISGNYNLLLWTLSYHQVLIILLFEGIGTSFLCTHF